MSLLSVLTVNDLDNSYKNVLSFWNIQEQESYFLSKAVGGLKNLPFKFIGKDTINIEVNYFEILKYSYVTYLNESNDQTKRFYAFLSNPEYVSQSVTRVTLEIDIMQSYQFDYKIGECYVDREHQNRWIRRMSRIFPIFNTIAENLDIGSRYHLISKTYIEDPNMPKIGESNVNLMWIIVISKNDISLSSAEDLKGVPTNLGGITTNIFAYYFPVIDSKNLPQDMGRSGYEPRFFADKYGISGRIELKANLPMLSQSPEVLSISICRYAPFQYEYEEIDDPVYKELKSILIKIPDKYNTQLPGFKMVGINAVQIANNNELGGLAIKNMPVAFNDESFNKIIFQKEYDYPDKWPDYSEPANTIYENKLRTNPYANIKIITSGKELNFYEEYTDGALTLLYSRALNVISTEIIQPRDYTGTLDYFNTEYIPNANEINLKTDAWQLYAQSHKASLKNGLLTQVGGMALNVGLAVATGGATAPLLIGQAINIGTTIAKDMMAKEDIKKTPDDIRQSGVDITTQLATNDLHFIVNEYEIYPEYKYRIFKYFQHFGYKASAFKIPNIKSRYYYNYLRLIDVNINGSIPVNIKNKITEILQRGTTFWHYRDSATFKGIGNYIYENAEV